jgi:hypothetical protein
LPWICNLLAAEPRIVPAEPPLAELTKQASDAAIVLVCKPNGMGTGLEVFDVLKGKKEFAAAKDRIAALIPKGDLKALSKKEYRELIFIGPANELGEFARSHTVALWPQHDETLNGRTIRFLSHDYATMKRALQGAEKKAQQAMPSDGQ